MTTAEVREAQILDLLAPQYRAQGYTFIKHPDRDLLPAFLEGYVPDAIALKDARKLAIEVKQSKTGSNKEKLEDIARRFKNQLEWQFLVVYAADVEQPSLRRPKASDREITQALNKVLNLSDLEQYDAAFVIAWAAFEAAARNSVPEQAKKILAPKSIIESLQRNGVLLSPAADELRRLVQLRTAIVHGDYGQHATKRHVEVMTKHIRNLMSADNVV